MQTTYHTTPAALAVYIARQLAAGFAADATITTDGTSYQPAALIYDRKTYKTEIARLNALADGTHHHRRTRAREHAETIITRARLIKL